MISKGTRHEKNTTNERDAWAQGLHRCGECCKQRDCMAVGTVASTATAWLLARLQAQRVHGCWQGCKHSDCIAVGIYCNNVVVLVVATISFSARGQTPMAGVCFLPAVTSGLAARSTKCHRLAATMHGIDELVAPTTPTYVSRLYLSTHLTIRRGFVSTGRDILTRNIAHHFCKQQTIL